MLAWKKFRRSKRTKKDVAQFEFSLEDNLFSLHRSLEQKSYEPEQYTSFYVRDPKLRLISKATVRDRVLHQAVFRILYRIFDPTFIHDSYSCRRKRGVHRGVLRLERFAKQVTRNYHRPAYVLKCDVRKFFDSIDQKILVNIIERKISDPEALWLIRKIVNSFSTQSGKGLPLGNVTSQLFANIYLNELDQFVKHELKQKYYLRYCDDFVILGLDRAELFAFLPHLKHFLSKKLELIIHPGKVSLRKVNQGIDFLGYVVLPHYKALRTTTKHRILNRAARGIPENSWQSYLGMLKHCRGFKILTKMLAATKH